MKSRTAFVLGLTGASNSNGNNEKLLLCLSILILTLFIRGFKFNAFYFFFDAVWYILNRVPAGIKFQEYLLPQQPIITEMTMDESDFKLRVEDLLGKVNCPVDRQIAVEVRNFIFRGHSIIT